MGKNDECITEYNEEKVMDAIRREYQEEGIENALRIVLEFGIDIDAAVEKTAQEYQVDSQKVWKIWEKMKK